MSTCRLVLADDHVLFREGIKSLLEKKADIEVVGEAGDGLELLRLLNKVIPQIVILDISMPNLRGIEAIREIKTTHPEVKVLVCTMHKDRKYLDLAFSAGADGYLLKEDAITELSSALETIQRGKKYITSLLSGGVIDEWAQFRRGEYVATGESERLTHRQREVLKLIAEGKSRKEIGELLFISVRTVERHRANIMEKLGIKRNADLVKYAIQRGYT